MQFRRVKKGDDVLVVHPSTLQAHQKAGWVDAGEADDPVSESADANGDGKVTAAELKAALTEAGVKFHANLGKDKLAALWAAFQRWGMTADEWNNLADEDKAARMANVGAD
jgi:hypothetical protein